MAYQKVINANAYRHKGGTVLFGGAIDGVNVTNAPGSTSLGFRTIGYRFPPVSATAGTAKPYSSGTYAYKMESGRFIMRRYTSHISGVASTTLLTGASHFFRRSINLLEKSRRFDVTSWNYVTGAATTGGNAGAAVTYNDDQAARPTRAVPGEYVYLSTGKTPTQGDYEAKTNG